MPNMTLYVPKPLWDRMHAIDMPAGRGSRGWAWVATEAFRGLCEDLEEADRGAGAQTGAARGPTMVTKEAHHGP